MSEEWGPWIEHDGKWCPDIVGLTLELKVERDASVPNATAHDCEYEFSAPWLWAVIPCRHQIVAYRIRKPRGMTIPESLLENLPDEVTA